MARHCANWTAWPADAQQVTLPIRPVVALSELQNEQAEPVAGLQRELHVVAVLAHRPAEALLRLADPVLDRVLVQHQLLGGRLVAAPAPQEGQQGLTQA